MTEQQINALAKYLGCEYSATHWPISLGTGETGKFNPLILLNWVDEKFYSLELHLKPLSSLTQEDFERMIKEVGLTLIRDTTANEWVKTVNKDRIIWRAADWLRNNGYYLGEESIKEFVKLTT